MPPKSGRLKILEPKEGKEFFSIFKKYTQPSPTYFLTVSYKWRTDLFLKAMNQVYRGVNTALFGDQI